MNIIKKLTGKNPADFEPVAKAIIDNTDKETFAKLVEQDDFLFEFIKSNVAQRLKNACNQNNYMNILEFFNSYSSSYDLAFAEVLHRYGDDALKAKLREMLLAGNDSQKAYAAKYFSLNFQNSDSDLIPFIREYSESAYEPLAFNSIELLSKLNDSVSKDKAIQKLSSDDEFEQYDGIKFLIQFGAKDCLNDILNIMKESAMAENIASEIPYLVPLEELLSENYENCLLVLCNIVSAMPEIISLGVVVDFDLLNLIHSIKSKPLDSMSAVFLRLAKDKFKELAENDEYLYDLDKNTKEVIYEINNLLSSLSEEKLDSYLYDELYEESDFVFFALNYVNEVAELEALLDSKNQTLVLQVLTKLKEKNKLTDEHKKNVYEHITSDEIKSVIQAL